MRTIEVSPRAEAEIERARLWWFENRPKAPWAFIDSLEAAFARLETEAGMPPIVGPRNLRRILLPRVRFHLYYRVRDATTVDVLSLWQSNRLAPGL